MDEECLEALNEVKKMSNKLTRSIPRLPFALADKVAEWTYVEIATAVRAEREACCAVMCWLCEAVNAGEEWAKPAVLEEHFNWGETWVHHVMDSDGKWIVIQCRAAAIRERAAPE